MENSKGILYVVATPIGNLQDITLRAIQTLKSVSTIVCEDTRVSSKLLNNFDIKEPLIALNDFNEEQISYSILKKLETDSVALISDAGTPLISDPGYRLVNKASKNGVKIVPIPGPSAVITALSASALPTDTFVFLGFLPKSKTKMEKKLKPFKEIESTIIIYESPHRIVDTLEVIHSIFGDIKVSIARELTKIHEEVFANAIQEIISEFEKRPPKGELVILFHPNN